MFTSEEKNRRFRVLTEAQNESDRTQRVWGVTNPHDAKAAQYRANMAFEFFMKVMED